MATLPLPVAILDDLICGTGNEVIQDGDRKRKGRHFAPRTAMGVQKLSLYYFRSSYEGVLEQLMISLPEHLEVFRSNW